MAQEGNRQVMVGTISLYDAQGERQHTLYVAATPEYGKATFHQRLSREIDHIVSLFPHAMRTGVADGSEDNWTYLEQYTKDNCVDFHHATGYLGGAARAVAPRSFADRQRWLDQRCHDLKHKRGAAEEILAELEALPRKGLSEIAVEDLDKAISYFTNQKHRMKYAQRVAAHKPIGSGVTEAACKTIVKMRLCKTGAKWKEQGAAIVLSLRCLVYTPGRWEQFWAKVDRYGFPVALAA